MADERRPTTYRESVAFALGFVLGAVVALVFSLALFAMVTG
jgi:hypothetical protein